MLFVGIRMTSDANTRQSASANSTVRVTAILTAAIDSNRPIDSVIILLIILGLYNRKSV